MQKKELVLRQSPFIFIKYLVIIEFLFALAPLTAAWLLGLEESYDNLALARSLPFGWMLTIVLTTVQVVVLGLAFVIWYLPTYVINDESVIYKRGGLYQDTELIPLRDVKQITVHQGLLGRRLSYGNLLLSTNPGDKTVTVRNIQNPSEYQVRLRVLSVESSPVEPARALPTDRETPPLHTLLASGENQNVEFKASLVWDYRREMANKDLYQPVMKNVVAFLNSEGGDLLIGVSDDRELLGLEPDLRTLPKRDVDGFENVFNMAFNKMVGVEYRHYVEVTFPDVDGVVICRLAVRPSPQPAYLRYRGSEHFYIRAGNASQPLPVSKAASYIQSHFIAERDVRAG